MNWVVIVALLSGCMASPLQQGNLKIVNYRANREGIFPQNEGIPIAPQPIVYNPQNPYLIQEPTPLTYSSVGGAVLTERDQQRHINVDEEIEAREEGVEEEPKPAEEQPKSDSNDQKDDKVDDQKPVQSETAALVGSSILPIGGGVQSVSIGADQYLISGQRRLVEPQPQLYGLKGKVVPQVLNIQSQYIPQQRVIYHNLHPVQQQVQQPYHVQHIQQHVQHAQPVQVQQQLPIHVEEHRISGHGVQVRKPVVQYQVNTVQKPYAQSPYVPREWIRKPIQLGVKGSHQIQQQQIPVQYYIQPIIPSDISVYSSGQQDQVQPQVINLQGVKTIQQRGQEDIKVEVPKRQDVDSGVQSVQDLNLGSIIVQNVQQQQKPEVLAQKGVKSPIDHSVNKVVIHSSQHQVPVVGQQPVIGYNLIGQSPQQILVQQPIQHSVSSVSQQNIPVQYVPVSDIQRYYQIVQSSVPIQQNYAIQSPQVVEQPIQYSVGQLPQSVVQSPQVFSSVVPIDQGAVGVGGVQGSQRIAGLGVQQVNVPEERYQGVKGQDLRVNPLADQRQQRSFIFQHQGVKGAVNV